MKETKTIQIEVPADKKAEWQEVGGKIVLVMVDEKDNRPVTERIKTFDDAREALGDEHPFVKEYWRVVNVDLDITQDLIAYLKLRIIVAALNEGWEPKFETGEYRYFPWFYTKEEYDKLDDEKRALCSSLRRQHVLGQRLRGLQRALRCFVLEHQQRLSACLQNS